jgi:hypothetical protein
MYKKKNFLVFILFILLPLAGCGQLMAKPTDSPFRLTLTAERFAFQTKIALGPEEVMGTEMARFEQTWAAYTPEPTLSPTLKPTITPPIPGSVTSICLNVEQAYGAFSGPFPPSLELAQRLLKQSGFEVLKPGADCDTSLEIQLTLLPVAEKYSNMGASGSSSCYTAANATGTATLTQPGKPARTIELNQGTSRQGGIITIISECPSPTQAPVEGVAKRAILQALSGTIGVKALFAAAKDEDDSIRSNAIWDIYMLCYDDLILVPQQVFLDALADPSTAVRNSAIITLGQLDKRADFAFDKIVQVAMNDPDAEIRSTALYYLSRIRQDDPQLFPLYRQALNDPDERVQEDAIRGLGDLEEAAYDAIPDILAYFRDHPEKSFEIVSCLREITGETLYFELATWEAWWEEHGK